MKPGTGALGWVAAGPARLRWGALLAGAVALGAGPDEGPADDPARRDAGCLSCHEGIEDMHPFEPLSCTRCHGGRGDALQRERAHVEPRLGWPPDERVLPRGFDPGAVRFRNPSDLRVVDETCGVCHPSEVHDLTRSLHGTTAGHLNDGLYENGVLPRRGSRYGIFAVRDDDGDLGQHGQAKLDGIGRLRVPQRPDGIGGHFADLPRKACMQCHLYSAGVGVRGRLGLDGLYRGSGCAACHVTYAEDGRSASGDPTADRLEPGHPLRHRLVTAPPRSTCLHCHVGDASIGNGFRGLAQLYPRMPAGPDVPGTTDRLIAGQFFVADPLLTPADIHHDAGLHCVDCHTSADVMGDGNVYGAMEHGVEIECMDCHGTFTQPATGRTSRGTPLTHLRRKGDLVLLTSRVTGRTHRVKQARDVIDPGHPDHDERAARAMTPEHAGLECYACHAGWSTNFFGFHFDRNQAFTQLDLLRGLRTAGRVTTQERVFATLRQLVLGVNAEGKVAPFMVGFSSMGTVRDQAGAVVLDQALPRTAAGLSGMSLVPHQTHTVQPAARDCVECHRSPSVYGLGTGGPGTSSFSLARGVLFVAGERGLDTLLLDREDPAASLPLARLPLGGARKVVVDSDPVTGFASTAFVVVERAGVALVDVGNPAFPRLRSFVAAGDARDVALAGDLLLVANGTRGVRVVDVSDRDHPRLLSDIDTREARGLCLQWPRVYVADGEGGLLVADVSVPSEPSLVGAASLGPPDGADRGDARAVAVWFQPARPQGHGARTRARMLAMVANGRYGPALLDVTDPSAPLLLTPGPGRYTADREALDVAVEGRFELGDTSGARPTVELDLAILLVARPERGGGELVLLDVSDPTAPVLLDELVTGAGLPAGGALVRSFQPPRLVARYMVAGEAGLAVVDVSRADAASVEAALGAFGQARDVATEAFAFDRMLDETGRQLKDISHEGARFFTLAEIHRLLRLPGQATGARGATRSGPGRAYAGAVVPGGRLRNSLGVDRTDAATLRDRLRRGFRLAPEEDYARLVRRLDPVLFDANGDQALGPGELERLTFAALDANADGELDGLEWPRHPASNPERLDRDGDGVVTRDEMHLGAESSAYLDLDGDGQVRFAEWPWVVDEELLPSLALAPPEGLLRLLKRRGFRDRRPAVHAAVAGENALGDVQLSAVAAAVARARARPLTDVSGALAPPGFVARYDLDGDGAVSPDELEPFERVARRCDRDGNGVLDRRDAAQPDR